jgi:hypothetical protein
MENLTSIGGELLILNNDALTSLSGLENMKSVGGSTGILYNDGLTSFLGLENLDSIGGDLLIYNNYALTNLSGLESLTCIEGDLKINANNALSSLSGLDNIDAGSIFNLGIYNNDLLSACEVKSICNYLAAPNGTVEIHDNALGCNSMDEVQETCPNDVEEFKYKEEIFITPNPLIDKITISCSILQGFTQLSIFNISGEKVIERQLAETETQIDISALPRGVYFVRVQDEKMVEIAKFVKK